MFKTIDFLVTILLIVGGLNWGFVSFLDFNLVTFIFGASMLTKVVYGLVAASAVYRALGFFGISFSDE